MKKKTTLKLTSKQRKQLLQLQSFGKVEEPYKIIFTIPQTSYLAAFVLMCRIVVQAEVSAASPQLNLTRAQLKIIIGTSGVLLTDADIQLALHLSQTLSTLDR